MEMTNPMYREVGVQLSKFCFLVKETRSFEVQENLTVLTTTGFKSLVSLKLT